MTNHRTPGNPGDEFDDDFDDFDDFDRDPDSDLDEDADDLDAEFDALTSRLSARTGDVYDDESDDEQEDDSELADLKALFGDDGFRILDLKQLLQVDEPADSSPRHRKIEKELDDEDDDEDDDVVDVLGANMLVPSLPLEQVLQILVDGQPVAPNELGIFSNLTAVEAREVARRWPEIAGELRAAIVSTLVELDEGVVLLDLGEFLRVALADSFAPVRVWAIEGLHEFLSADLLTRFIALARSDEDAGVRAAAAEALGPFVLAGELDEFDAALSMRAEQTLLELLGDETQPVAVQCRALESIAYSGEAGVRQLIEESYYDENDELRVSAVVAMGRSADTHWRRMVVAELSSASPRMRAEACYACGELEATAGRSVLLELLLDEEEAVRLGAIFALARVGGEQARDALRLVADGEDDVLAEAAAVALEEMLFYAGGEADTAPLFDDDNDDDMDDDFDDWESGPDAGDEPPARRRR